MEPLLSRSTERIEESPTRMLDRVLESTGIKRGDVIRLSAGQPGAPPPGWAVERFTRALEGLGLEAYRYTPSAGRRRLRELIAVDLAETGGPEVSWEQVVVTAGGQEAMYSVLASILDPGSEVVVLEPMYFGYWGLLSLMGARVVVVEERLEEGFRVPVERVQELVSRGRTRAIIVVSPDNPTGRVVGRDDAKALAEIASDAGAWLVVDEAYRTLVYEGGNPVFYDYAPENVVGIGAFSKDPGIPGWRLGYVYGPERLVERARLVSEKIVYCPPLAAQLLVEAYLSDREARLGFIETVRREYRRRRDVALEAVAGIPGARAAKPQGSMFIYIDLEEALEPLGISSKAFAEELLKRKRVAVVPGEFFERRKRRVYRVRVNFTSEPLERLVEGIERIGEAIGELRGNA